MWRKKSRSKIGADISTLYLKATASEFHSKRVDQSLFQKTMSAEKRSELSLNKKLGKVANARARSNLSAATTKKVNRLSETLYTFDNSIGNLEFDLEDIHNKLYNCSKKYLNNTQKVIYVIDEMDKLEKTHPRSILKYLKNLFTLANAIFIFIGNELMYEIGQTLEKDEEKQPQQTYRDKAYTYFTGRYLLGRPLWQDLKNYFC